MTSHGVLHERIHEHMCVAGGDEVGCVQQGEIRGHDLSGAAFFFHLLRGHDLSGAAFSPRERSRPYHKSL